MQRQELHAVWKQIHLKKAEALVSHKHQRQKQNYCEWQIRSKLIAPIILFFMDGYYYVVIINPLEKDYIQWVNEFELSTESNIYKTVILLLKHLKAFKAILQIYAIMSILRHSD